MRVVYESVDQLRELVRDLSEDELATTDFGVYSASAFYDDMARVTRYLADPDLVAVLVEQSHATLRWMADLGIRFVPAYGRQAFKVGDIMRFWVASRSTPRAAGRGSSRRSTRWRPRQASRSATVCRRCISSPTVTASTV